MPVWVGLGLLWTKTVHVVDMHLVCWFRFCGGWIIEFDDVSMMS